MTRPTLVTDELVERVAIAVEEEIARVLHDDATLRALFAYQFVSIARAAIAAMPTLVTGQLEGEGWHLIADVPVPKGEMFIWAKPKGIGQWSLGLAYWNVSGGWSDAYGSPHATGEATYWKSIGAPPAHPQPGPSR